MCHEDNNGTDYAYTDAGRLETRTWQRGVITTYGYDNGGRLETVDYTNETNGHTTPDLVNTYDTLGRLRTVTRGGVLHAETTYRLGDLQRHLDKQQIDTLNQSVSYTYEDGTNGTLAGRPNGYTFADGTAVWGFDNAGRLAAVADTTDNFNYGYRYTPDGTIHRGVLPSEAGTQSHMPFSLVGPQVETTLAYENTRNALAYRENKIPSGPLSKFSYTVNGIEQRDSLTPTGSAFSINTPFSWGYNQRGELTTANRTGNATFERSYSYDGIGNRLSATDHTGSDTNYFADAGATTAGGNALNQYAKINYPGSTTIEPQHDTDGNMETGPVPGVNGLSPGVPIPANATLTWDAENRLVKAVLTSITVEYAYDHQSRLISRTVGSLTTRYLYDGWNRIAEYESNGTGHTLKRTYLWGMDLSGSMQGAGGVGGLLSMTVHDTTSATFYPTYDGNGNVSEYVDENGDKAAHFEYDPFGNLTVDSESNAGDFPYRFSTKPQDLTTGLYYYGYRWYDPATGRWPSRDPIGEEGGDNMYVAFLNDGTNQVDLIGLHAILEKGTDQIDAGPISVDILGFKANFSAKGPVFWKKVCCIKNQGSNIHSDVGKEGSNQYIASTSFEKNGGVAVTAGSEVELTSIKNWIKTAIKNNKEMKKYSKYLDLVDGEISVALNAEGIKVKAHYDGCKSSASWAKIEGSLKIGGNVGLSSSSPSDASISYSTGITGRLIGGGILGANISGSAVSVNLKNPTVHFAGSASTTVTINGSSESGSIQVNQNLYLGQEALQLLTFDMLTGRK